MAYATVARMSVIVYGTPGGSLDASGAARYGQADARRGSWFERVTGGCLEGWLAETPGEYHLFHDLAGFDEVEGFGYGPMSLGGANIDHVILAGDGWLMVNAKGIGKGTLGLDDDGRGVLLRPDGKWKRHTWLERDTAYVHAGILMRLTGAHGCWAWVVPDYTDLTHPSLAAARCLRYGPDVTMITTALGARTGALNQLLVMSRARYGAEAVPPDAIAALRRYVCDKSAPPREGFSKPPRKMGTGGSTGPRGENHPGAKLTEAILAEARELRAAGETERAIGERFGVSPSTIHRALAGQTWRPAGSAPPAAPVAPPRGPSAA